MTTNEDEPISTINVTPFVDVVLVILIIFMVTAPMIVKSSLEVQLPKAASGIQSSPSPLTVTLDQDGQIDINGQRISRNQLQDEVSLIIQDNPNTQAIISADKDISHGEVIAVIDIIKTAGVSKFAIATTE